MRHAALLVALGLLGMLGAPAAAQHEGGHGGPGGPGGGGTDAAGGAASVRIGFVTMSPARVDIVTGEDVMWMNDSTQVHTVTADDNSFDSGRLTSSQTFSRRFTAAGEAPYFCTLHAGMQGVVATHDLLLEPPPTAASPKRPFVLAGRAGSALGAGAPVSLEADRGAGFEPVASTTIEADRTFEARFVPTATATYRAVAGKLTSPPIDLPVLDRRITLTTRRVKRQAMLRVNVTPAAPGGFVVLQLYLPERFGWWPIQRARLDRHSTAHFTVRSRRHLQARAILTLPDGATRLAVSRTAHLGWGS